MLFMFLQSLTVNQKIIDKGRKKLVQIVEKDNVNQSLKRDKVVNDVEQYHFVFVEVVMSTKDSQVLRF